ncbi:MAG: homoserine kinase [Betaproteobacteria bacterium]|nr:homoserine kinase [Betaproteobacteria bacterium]
MSVFTKVSPQELGAWLKGYAVGTLTELKGITAGIENTNYFVTTTRGRYVLTLFEKLTAAELPFYLNFMAHLASHGIPCPAPIADQDNSLLGTLNGRPAALVTFLPGAPVVAPTSAHCALVGTTLADMHLAGRSYRGDMENPRGPKWWRETAPRVMPFLDATRQDLLQGELEYQSRFRFNELPRGPVHADLFRDNVLFGNGVSQLRLGGVIDFYFAGIDALLYDVAVTLNDWCIEPDGRIDPERAMAFLDAYRMIRGLTADEREAWPVMLRAGALRFWLSRLFDFYLPRPGELTHAHDPEHFRRILELRRAHPGIL